MSHKIIFAITSSLIILYCLFLNFTEFSILQIKLTLHYIYSLIFILITCTFQLQWQINELHRRGREEDVYVLHLTITIAYTTQQYLCSGSQKNKQRSKQWVINTKRADLEKYSTEQLYNGYTLCANHFEDSQFMNPQAKMKLIHNALPTLFDVPNPPPKLALK